MGLHDRDYYRDEGPPAGGGFLADSPITKWVIIINVAIFFLHAFVSDPEELRKWENLRQTEGVVDMGVVDLEKARPFFYMGAYNHHLMTEHFQVWRLVTYQFLHSGFGHIFVNMLGLFFFGPMVERWWGTRRYVYFYLLCGTIGAVLYSLFSVVGVVPGEAVIYRPGTDELQMFTSLVGASGSLFGVLIAGAIIAPNARVMLLIPPIPMKLRTLAILIIVIAAANILIFGTNPGGEAAHLGGALMGWLLMKYPHFITPKGGGVEVIRPSQRKRFRVISGDGGKEGSGKKKPTREEVDRVLDKVAKQGVASLTEDEKKTLQAARDDLLGR